MWIFIFEICYLSSSLGFVFIMPKLFYLVDWQEDIMYKISFFFVFISHSFLVLQFISIHK